jgi:hypothetical protein
MSAAPGSLSRLTGQVSRGMRVRYRSREYVVAGFDPMSVQEPFAYLEDVETGEACEAPLDELFGPGEPLAA